MLIGITGQMESGKTTAAEWLTKKYDFSIFSFAHPLKKSCAELTGLDMKYFTDTNLKYEKIELLNGKTTRWLMQSFGTEFVRNTIHPDFWINRMKQKLDKISVTGRIVIDDIRFANEAKLIHDLGGKVIHIIRGERKSYHSSEKIDFLTDFRIDNNFSKDVLHNQLKSFMEIFYDD